MVIFLFKKKVKREAKTLENHVKTNRLMGVFNEQAAMEDIQLETLLVYFINVHKDL